MQNMRNTKPLLKADEVLPGYTAVNPEKRFEREPSNVEPNEEFHIDHEKERKLLLKFDIYAIGLLGLFFMLSNLDRSNLGNASVTSMPADIGLVGNQLGTAVTLFYATLVPAEAPMGVLLKMIGPHYLLSFCAFSWGLTTFSMGFIHNATGLYTCRLFLGLFEAAVAPCFDTYIGCVYKKHERAKRSSVMFCFAALASALGGLLAYGLTQISGPKGFQGWRWLFIVEGAMTIFLVPLFFFVFPKEPGTAWFLTAEEREIMRLRYLDPHWGYAKDEKFEWIMITRALSDPKQWAFIIYHYGMYLSYQAFTLFLPTIIHGFGYTGLNANLLTVPVYLWGMFSYIIIAFFSDRVQRRGPVIAGSIILVIIGEIILLGITSPKVRYLACFLFAMGIYPAHLDLMWLIDNVSGHYKRATMIGVTLSVSHTAGLVVGQIFTDQSKPRYLKGFFVGLGMLCFSLVAVFALMYGMARANKRREMLLKKREEDGDPIPDQPEKGDYNPHFRYTL